MPLEYRNEVGTGLSLKEAQALATPTSTLTPPARAYELAPLTVPPPVPHDILSSKIGSTAQEALGVLQPASTLRGLPVWSSAQKALADKRETVWFHKGSGVQAPG